MNYYANTYKGMCLGTSIACVILFIPCMFVGLPLHAIMLLWISAVEFRLSDLLDD